VTLQIFATLFVYSRYTMQESDKNEGKLGGMSLQIACSPYHDQPKTLVIACYPKLKVQPNNAETIG